MSKSDINRIINEVTGARAGKIKFLLSRAKIIKIVKTYVATLEQMVQTSQDGYQAGYKVGYEQGYKQGYKQGYIDRSNEIYDSQIHARWQAYVNELKDFEEPEPETETKLQIVEPEVIICSE